MHINMMSIKRVAPPKAAASSKGLPFNVSTLALTDIWESQLQVGGQSSL